MARIDWVEQRLNLWAEWVARGRCGVGGRVLPMFLGARRGGAAEASIPINEEECWHTEAGIKSLPEPLRQTVIAYYVSGTYAAQDRLHISRAVLSQRLDRAHRLLAGAWVTVGPLDQSLPRSFKPLTN